MDEIPPAQDVAGEAIVLLLMANCGALPGAYRAAG